MWFDHVTSSQRANSEKGLICGNKMPTRCNRWFLLQILLLAQHVSGTIMPIIRSWRVLYRWLLHVVFGALVFKLSVWCWVEGYVSGLRAAAQELCRKYREYLMLDIWWEVNDGDFPPITYSVTRSFYPTAVLSNIVRTEKSQIVYRAERSVCISTEKSRVKYIFTQM